MASRVELGRAFERIGCFHTNLFLRPDMMPIAVRTKRLRLKVRKALEASPVGLDAGLDETAGSGTLDHELEHEHEGFSMRHRRGYEPNG